MADALSIPACTEAHVTIQSGPIVGVDDGHVRRFLGIPYAAAPVGALRFAVPQKRAPWIAPPFDATQHGKICWQPKAKTEDLERVLPGIDFEPLIGNSQAQGNDALVLNIWTPSGTPQSAPVMVFIHGGGFVGGAGSADAYDGASFARAGVVLVTINYRLGIEGFLPIPGAPTNLGLRDQIFALEWVRDNIAAFGGDAGNVTVFGESAGGFSVANLLASPLAKGLFKRAIVQSGHGDLVRPVPVARRLVTKLARMLRIRETVEAFRATPVRETLAAQAKISRPGANIDLRNADGREPAFGLTRFLPVYGDDVLPERPIDALRKGAGADVELIVGTNREEMNLYFVGSGIPRKLGKFLTHFITRRFEPKSREILRGYGIDERGKRPGEVFTTALTDLVFRLPARRFARAHKGRTHVYDFGWRSPVYKGELGAAHGLELPFVFNTIDCTSGPRGVLGDAPPQELADRMHAIWTEFAKTGALPWQEYEASSRMVYRPEKNAAEPEAPFPAEQFFSD